MKKIINIKNSLTLSLLLATLSLFSSCKDFLYVEPTNRVSVNTYDDVRSLLGGALLNYTLRDDYFEGAPNIFLGSEEPIITFYYNDDYDTERYLSNAMARNFRGQYMQSLDWRNETLNEAIWSLYYRNIGFYNIVLNELQKHSSGSVARDQEVSGEARVIRAMSFFKLMQYFSPYKRNDLGLPLNTNPDAVGTYDQSRKTQAENYAFVISELNDVLNYSTQPADNYNLFYNKTLIHGLLAQIYLYKGDSGAKENTDYANAITHAQAVLDAGITSDTYQDYITGSDSWGVLKNKNEAPLVFLYDKQSPQDAYAGISIWRQYQYASNNLYQLYASNDLRKEAFFNEDQAFIKYQNNPKGIFTFFSLCSGAEMRLIIAEANARLGNADAAKQALKLFATPRYENYVEPADGELLQSILDERRKEFCFTPYMRWLDLTRLQTAFSHNALDPQDETKTYTIVNGDYRFCLPLPRLAELKDNNIAQNPGWEGY